LILYALIAKSIKHPRSKLQMTTLDKLLQLHLRLLRRRNCKSTLEEPAQ